MRLQAKLKKGFEAGCKVTTNFISKDSNIKRTVLGSYKEKNCQSGIMIIVDHPKNPGIKDLILDIGWFIEELKPKDWQNEKEDQGYQKEK